jgi:hypothetical protein
VAKGFGSTPIKKWHFTKAPKGSKAFEMATNARKEDTSSRFFPVIVQCNTRKFELVIFLVKRTKKVFDILLATVDKETVLSQKEAEEIAKEFSKGLSLRPSDPHLAS